MPSGWRSPSAPSRDSNRRRTGSPFSMVRNGPGDRGTRRGLRAKVIRRACSTPDYLGAGSTITVASIWGWIEQTHRSVPGESNRNANVSFSSRAPDRNFASTLVTVCGSASRLFQTTVVPIGIVSEDGENINALSPMVVTGGACGSGAACRSWRLGVVPGRCKRYWPTLAKTLGMTHSFPRGAPHRSNVRTIAHSARMPSQRNGSFGRYGGSRLR
jgi:hypothetical protein